MNGPGLGGSALPRARPGDYERALALVAGLGADKAVKAKLTELRDAQAANDLARENAEVAVAESKRLEGLAREAEADARSQRTSFATETAETDRRLTVERQELAGEQRRFGEWDEDLKAQDADLKQREDALKVAFRAYQGATI